MGKDSQIAKCDQEPAIRTAIACDELPEDLLVHLAGCAVCSEVHWVGRKILQMANDLAEDPRPSAASMWWRLNFRIRQEKARRVQAPLIWLARILYASIMVLFALAVASVPGVSGPVGVIGLLALSALVLFAVIALWTWSRLKI